MTPSADDLDRMSDREARAVYAAEARNLRERLNDALAEVRALAESDAQHVAMMQEEHKRRVEAEAEVRRLQAELDNPVRTGVCVTCVEAEIKKNEELLADNERMRRGIQSLRDRIPRFEGEPHDPTSLEATVDNLLAGREWNNSADGAKGESK